jgi:hypothetical protein
MHCGNAHSLIYQHGIRIGKGSYSNKSLGDSETIVKVCKLLVKRERYAIRRTFLV